MNKKTVVIGASAKTDRYSNRAVRTLHKHGHEVIALGFEHAMIENTTIETDWKVYDNIDTVTLYLNPQRQKEFYNYILFLLLLHLSIYYTLFFCKFISILLFSIKISYFF